MSIRCLPADNTRSLRHHLILPTRRGLVRLMPLQLRLNTANQHLGPARETRLALPAPHDKCLSILRSLRHQSTKVHCTQLPTEVCLLHQPWRRQVQTCQRREVTFSKGFHLHLLWLQPARGAQVAAHHRCANPNRLCTASPSTLTPIEVLEQTGKL